MELWWFGLFKQPFNPGQYQILSTGVVSLFEFLGIPSYLFGMSNAYFG